MKDASSLLSSAGRIWRGLRTLAGNESGQDLVEYALVAGLIGLGAVAALSGLSGKIKQAFNSIGSNISSAV